MQGNSDSGFFMAGVGAAASGCAFCYPGAAGLPDHKAAWNHWRQPRCRGSREWDLEAQVPLAARPDLSTPCHSSYIMPVLEFPTWCGGAVS